MPESTLDHLVWISTKIYTKLQFFTSKRLDLNDINLKIFLLFLSNIKRINPFDIPLLKMKWQDENNFVFEKFRRKWVRWKRSPLDQVTPWGMRAVIYFVLEEVGDEPNPPLAWSSYEVPLYLIASKEILPFTSNSY